jgi:hypothetical protein
MALAFQPRRRRCKPSFESSCVVKKNGFPGVDNYLRSPGASAAYLFSANASSNTNKNRKDYEKIDQFDDGRCSPAEGNSSDDSCIVHHRAQGILAGLSAGAFSGAQFGR